MIIKIGRREFDITNEDKIFDNGACYQLITQTYRKGWHKIHPVVSKSQFSKLLKNKALVLIEKKFKYKTVNGEDVYYAEYAFDIDKINR